MSHKVIISIRKDGSLEIEVNGIKGPSCRDLTKGLEKQLGQAGKRKNKSEFYEKENEERLHQY